MNQQPMSLEDRVAALEQKSTNPVTGDQSPFQSALSPGGPYVQRVGNWGWTNGPISGQVDNVTGWTMKFKVPEWVTRILQCKITIEPAPLHALFPTVNALTSTVTSGNPSATTASPTSTHRHRWFNFVTSAGPTYTWRQGTSGPAISPNVQIPSDTAQDLDTDNPSATEQRPTSTHKHDSDIGHSHAVDFIVDDLLTAAGVTILIDGVDVTTALGGPWSAEAEVDIAAYLKSGVNPVTGEHTLEFTSTDTGQINVSFDWYVIGKPVAAP